MASKQATIKKLRKQFKVGDLVTWGNGTYSHVVIEVNKDGVIVDGSAVGWPNFFVSFSSDNRGNGPPRPGTLKTKK